MSRRLDVLARELSDSWHELGRVLASRRLLASLHGGNRPALSPTRRKALDVLAREPSGVRIGELAHGVGIEETTATRLVDRLEADGLVQRSRLATDRRVTVVALTVTGTALVDEIARRRRDFFRDVLRALEPEEREELVRLTARAASALRSTTEELIRR
jgi:DNA-binding MarR family transcriptional regulator